MKDASYTDKNKEVGRVIPMTTATTTRVAVPLSGGTDRHEINITVAPMRVGLRVP